MFLSSHLFHSKERQKQTCVDYKHIQTETTQFLGNFTIGNCKNFKTFSISWKEFICQMYNHRSHLCTGLNHTSLNLIDNNRCIQGRDRKRTSDQSVDLTLSKIFRNQNRKAINNFDISIERQLPTISRQTRSRLGQYL